MKGQAMKPQSKPARVEAEVLEPILQAVQKLGKLVATTIEQDEKGEISLTSAEYRDLLGLEEDIRELWTDARGKLRLWTCGSVVAHG